MRRLLLLGSFVLVCSGCGKAPADCAINVHDGGGIRRVVVVGQLQWKFVDGQIYGAKRIYADAQGQPKYEEYAEPADQKAYDTVYEYLTGQKPLKAD
jgi:hypothetical protein